MATRLSKSEADRLISKLPGHHIHIKDRRPIPEHTQDSRTDDQRVREKPKKVKQFGIKVTMTPNLKHPEGGRWFNRTSSQVTYYHTERARNDAFACKSYVWPFYEKFFDITREKVERSSTPT